MASFKSVLESMFKRAAIKEKYIKVLLANMVLYEQAFTSKTYDPEKNYEVLEFIGDPNISAVFCRYLVERFPQLNCSNGIRFLNKLKLNYISGKTFAQIAEENGFWPFINAAAEEKRNYKEKLLEDVFEAFMAVTLLVLDENLEIGCGYNVLYYLVKSLYDNIEMSLEYDVLYDNVSKLNELINNNPQLGRLYFDERAIDKTIVYVKQPGGVDRKIGESGGSGETAEKRMSKKERKQDAAGKALLTLKHEGYTLKTTTALFCK